MLDTVRYVEAPEGVEIAIRAAGPVSRLGAWLIDQAIRICLYIGAAKLLDRSGDWGLGVFVLFLFACEWFYPVLFEVYLGGATPGKRSLGLVVLHRDGTPVSWTSSLVRNLVLFADFLPFGYLAGLVSMLVDRDFRRLGDLAAGTVVSRRPETSSVFRVPDVPPVRPPVALQLDEQRALLEYAERLGTWSRERACELAGLVEPLTGVAGLAAVDAGAGADADGDADSGAGAADPAGAAAAAGVARLVGMASWVLGARRESYSREHEAEWQELEQALGAMEHGSRRRPWAAAPAAAQESAPGAAPAGTQPGTPADAGRVGTRTFPDLFRQVCHELALVRSRRYGTAIEARLNRLVLRGHQQLYRRTGVEPGGVLPFVLGGFARRVRSEARVVAAAALLFVGPGLLMAGAVLVWPELAVAALPADTLEEITGQFGPGGGAAAQPMVGELFARFGLYVWNNVSIAFRTFAGGVVVGIGSLFFLVYNGVVSGAVASHIHQVGFDRTFYAFVIGHGAFELTAIVLAGACGLRLGLAVLAPGPLRRSRSLLAAARATVPLLYGVTGMLFVAALIESFWSPGLAVSAGGKLEVGAGLWAGVLAYFTLAGRRHRP
jgi:uncharacterized membrane protein SpoIIM required for sporulation/uncharacterized RDD family membrane protein YckC